MRGAFKSAQTPYKTSRFEIPEIVAFCKMCKIVVKIFTGWAGSIKSLQMISSMLQYGIEVYFLDTSEIDDIGSVSKIEAEKLKENSKPINTENIFNIYWSN